MVKEKEIVMFTLENPTYLWLLLVISIFILLHFINYTSRKGKVIKFANYNVAKKINRYSRDYTKLIIRIIILILLVLALTGTVYEVTTTTKDTHLILLLDTTNAMSINEFEIMKKTTTQFMRTLPEGVKVGLVTISGENIGEKKLHENKEEAIVLVENLKQTSLERDLKKAFLSSEQIFLEEEEKFIRAKKTTSLTPQDLAIISSPRVMILITKGEYDEGEVVYISNTGNIAAYTIDIAIENPDQQQSESLQHIAQSTGGEYFSVEKEVIVNQALLQIAQSFQGKVAIELTRPILIGIFVLLLLGWILEYIRFGTIP